MFEYLNCSLSQSVGCWMIRWAFDMVNSIFLHEGLKFSTRETRSIVCYDTFRNSKLSKCSTEMLDGDVGFSRSSSESGTLRSAGDSFTICFKLSRRTCRSSTCTSFFVFCVGTHTSAFLAERGRLALAAITYRQKFMPSGQSLDYQKKIILIHTIHTWYVCIKFHGSGRPKFTKTKAETEYISGLFGSKVDLWSKVEYTTCQRDNFSENFYDSRSCTFHFCCPCPDCILIQR